MSRITETMDMARTVEDLLAENDELRRRLDEAEETLEAIREGRVDAFVLSSTDQSQIVAIDSADRPYRMLVEQMEQGAVTVAPDGTILYGNRRFSDMLGVPPRVLVGRSIFDHVDPESRGHFDRLLESGEVHCDLGEMILRVEGGARLPVDLAVNRVPHDETSGLCLIVTDLTEKKLHEQVVAEEILARSVFEQAGDAIVVYDGAGTILRASLAAHELCGFNPVGRPFEEAFASLHLSDDCSKHDPAQSLKLADFADRGTRRGEQVCFTRADGQTFDLLLSYCPLVDVEQFPRGSVMTLSNITPLKRAEEALRDADRRKDEFLAMLAHELRNPLAAINNAVQVATISPDRGQVEWGMDIVNRQIRHLTRMIDDLLDVSRITRGKIELRKELHDARSVISAAVEVVRPLADERKHELIVTYKPDGLWLEADPTRLEQIVVNLLTNAAKYTESGGHIWLTAGQDAGEVVISVRDDGSGIPPDKLPQMFELFAQGDRSIARSEGGLGIGLTLVRSIAEMHGGGITARSDGPGLGSEFTVRLPAARETPARARTAGRNPLAEARPFAGKPTAKILVVDDNHDTARGLSRLLTLIGHEVEVAHDGPSAIASALRFRPEFVLLDIGLPGLDGYQVAVRLRQQGLADATIIALTGYGQDEDRRRSREAGFDHHLVKPVDPATLLELIDA